MKIKSNALVQKSIIITDSLSVFENFESSSITKCFHQTWKNSDLSTHSKYALISKNSICSLHPDHKHILWTDSGIETFLEHVVKVQHSDLYSIYRRLPQNIMKVDFVRYLWMYYYGGIYCDLDIVCEKSFSPLIADRSVCFFARAWATGGKSYRLSVHQAWLASKPRHPVWLDIMRACGKFLDEGQTNVLDVTGPNSVSRALSEVHADTKFRDITVLPAEFFYQPGMTKTARHLAYCTHEATYTWRDKALIARIQRTWFRVNRRVAKLLRMVG